MFQIQVVSGSVYSLTIELVDTNCLRSENKERSKCQADASNGSRRICTVEIWDQPWLNSKQVRDPDCDASSTDGDARSPKTTTGGPRETITLSPDDEEVKNAANFALVRLDAFDDNNKKRILIKVLEAFSHVIEFPLFLIFEKLELDKNYLFIYFRALLDPRHST